MKKQMKTLGIVATTAALALGCAMPAFASAPSVGQDGTKTGTTTTGVENQTIVNLVGYNEDNQIVATIPVDMTVSAPKAGGELICPDASAYKITNNSPSSKMQIIVDDVYAKEGSASWEIRHEALTVNVNNMDTNVKQIALALQSGTDSYGSPTAPVFIGTKATTGKSTTLPAAEYTIESGANKGLNLSGYALPTKNGTGSTATVNEFSETQTEKAATLTYIIKGSKLS